MSEFDTVCLPNTVKHFISAIPKFRGLMKMTYWRKLIFAVMKTMSQKIKYDMNL